MPRQPNHCDLPPDFYPETAPPTLTIDWEAYLPLFEDEDISEEEKRELIEALWSIVVSFVDLGFGVHPVQQACGQSEVGIGDTSSDLVCLLKDDWNKAQQSEREDTWQDQ